MLLQILGTGCPKCKKLTKAVEKAVKNSGIEATVEKVTDLEQIMGFGVTSTPSLVVDGEVKSTGRMLTDEEILGFIQ